MTTDQPLRAAGPFIAHPPLAPGVWRVDSAHSEVTFRVKAMWGLLTVSGGFKIVDGTLHVDDAMTLRGRVRAHAATLDTGIRMRDRHLRSADFFDADRHPYVEFVARALTRAGDGRLRVVGDLVLRGTAYPLEAEATVLDVGDRAVETAGEVVVDHAIVGRALKRGGVIAGPAHLAARIRFVRGERQTS